MWVTLRCDSACGNTLGLDKRVQLVRADQEDVLDTSISQAGECGQPEAGVLICACPQTEKLAAALQVDPDR